ncbi:MAG: DUF4129 domain-containing protein [Actinomycetes bacterium]
MRFDGAPLDLGADQARELARHELLDPVYAQARPPWWREAAGWVLSHLIELVGSVAGGVASSAWLLVLVGLVVLVVVVVLRRTGTARRANRGQTSLFVGVVKSSAAYRADSVRAAGLGDYHSAVINRFRAIVRGLEEQGVLDERPGRTADEAAAETGTFRPTLAQGLRDGARAFDEVAYGGRPGQRDTYEVLVDLDTAVLT